MEAVTLFPMPDALAKPRLAATVIVLRDGDAGPEAFLMRRSMKSSFMPGAYVFPGGKVDPADAELAPAASSPAFLVAAVREVFEEAGVLLAVDGEGRHPDLRADADYWQQQRRRVSADSAAFGPLLRRHGLTIDTALVRPWSWWLTPAVERRRFDTRFFIAMMPDDQDPLHDGRETTDSLWMAVGQCLDRYQAGDVAMAPPTMATMIEMRDGESAGDLIASAPFDDALRYPFFGEDSQGRVTMVLAGDPAYPLDQPAVRGPRRVVLDEGRWWVVE